ncbi:glycoside hydrolase domain-containing protein [Ruegeria hyattellae]|uniref:glycoside hydrolase domain-containing protein n=1 Tax=Ruegeria hyattellae TaxID=3233337 RepID=UPI00355B3754
MRYGITTGRAHLNKLQMMYEGDAAIPGFAGTNPTPGFAAELDLLDDKTQGNREINWFVLPPFMTSSDMAAFAGRYFHGHATDDEVAVDEAFCLWAHGEGGDAEVPEKIFPIQRANAKWQAATGRDARILAKLEAESTLNAIAAALKVGDLIAQGNTLVVYLETAPGKLSPHYWRHWSKAVMNYGYLDSAESTAHPFYPGIICDFELYGTAPDGVTDTYWPETAVRNALGALATEGPVGPEPEDGQEDNRPIKTWLQPAPISIWARRMPEAAEVVPLMSIGWFSSTTDLPVHFRRVWDCALDTIPTDDPALTDNEIDMLRLVTIDESPPVTDGPDPLDWALRPQKSYQINGPEPEGDYNFTRSDGVPNVFWFTDTNIASEDINTPPTQIGLDHLDPASRADYERASDTEVEIRFLQDVFTARTPRENSDGGTDFEHDPIVHKPTFTGRYLPPRGGPDLSAQEAKDIAAGGLQVVSLYQQAADPLGSADPAHRMRESSMRQAFENAMAVGQPPFTPIYFAVDVDVDGDNWKEAEWLKDDAGNVLSKIGPDFAAVLGFYRTIRRVYFRDYIVQDGALPYYIGAYAPVKVLHAVYRAGLATHFWQSMAHTFGRPVGVPKSGNQADRWFFTSPGLRAWPQANLWQIRLASAGPTGFWTWPKNAVLAAPPFPQDDEAASWCDINVAWGNPGGWEPASVAIPLLPGDGVGGAA